MKLEMRDGYFILAIVLAAVLLAFAFWAGASLFMVIPSRPLSSPTSAHPATSSTVPLCWADADSIAGSHLNLPADPRHLFPRPGTPGPTAQGAPDSTPGVGPPCRSFLEL